MNSLLKANIFRYSLVFLIILTCITDVVSFFTSGLYQFEINPLVLYFKSIIGIKYAIALAIFVKVALVTVFSIFIAKYIPKPKQTHTWAYLCVYIGILMILVQAFGTYSNITTTIAYNNDPVNVQPMPIEQSVQMLNIVNIVYYAVTFVCLISFWIYENIFRKK